MKFLFFIFHNVIIIIQKTIKEIKEMTSMNGREIAKESGCSTSKKPLTKLELKYSLFMMCWITIVSALTIGLYFLISYYYPHSN